MGFRPLELNDFLIEQACDDFYGTLYAKSGHRFVQPDAIELFEPNKKLSCRVEYVQEKRTAGSFYATEHLQKKDKYAVFLDGNHPLIRITAQMIRAENCWLLKTLTPILLFLSSPIITRRSI